MAQIIASTMRNNVFTGEDGNRSVDFGKHVLAAAAIADTVDLQVIPAGTKLIGVSLVNAALGAGTTISLGWRNKDGTAGGSNVALLAAISTVAAAKTNSVFAPIAFTQDAVLYATVAGGAATGQIDTITDYLFQGTL